jgi:hypothetical protein
MDLATITERFGEESVWGQVLKCSMSLCLSSFVHDYVLLQYYVLCTRGRLGGASIRSAAEVMYYLSTCTRRVQSSHLAFFDVGLAGIVDSRISVSLRRILCAVAVAVVVTLLRHGCL